MIDIYAKFNQSLGALDQVGKRERFEEKAKSLTSIEAKLNLAESLLGVKESARYIAKNNGAGHNGHEEIRESAERITEVKARQRRDGSDKALWNAMGISEADQRKLRGDAPEGLTKLQENEYRFAIGIGMPHEEALVMCKLPHKALSRF